MKQQPVVSPLALLALFIVGSPLSAEAFSVTYDQDVAASGQLMHSKVLIKDDYFRIETAIGGMQAIVIKNSKGMFQCLPDQGIVMPMPALGPNHQVIERPDDYLGYLQEQNAKLLRTEAKGGYECGVYVYTDPKSRSEVTAWVAKSLQFPVRVELNGAEGRMEVDLSNIVLGAGIEDSAFELPAGAQMTSMDELLQGAAQAP